MKRSKSLHIGVGAILGVIAILGLFGCDLEEVIQNADANVESVREVTETFAPTGLLDLTVESSNGYVIVESADTATVTATATLRSRGQTLEEAEERVDAIVYDMSQDGNVVSLRYRSSEQTADVRRYSGVSFTVTVPRQADVQVDTSNGSITIRGIEGRFQLDTSNGDIDLTELVGVVHADTSNGRIDVEDVRGVLTLETSNGSIDIEDVEATVDARTSNGRIDFSGILVGDTHRLRTSNGTIDVEIPSDASVTIDASTSIGSIRTNLPLIGDTDGRDWNATLNPPATQTLELRTSNGTIRIEAL